jgi:hypothetical protein
MGTAALTLLGLTVLFAVLAILGPHSINTRGEKEPGPFNFSASIASIVLLIVTLIAGWLAIAPEYRLYRANIEKRIIVTQAIAEADADREHARGEVERAKGTAAANKIVAHSITEPYLRYLFINNLAHTKNQIVYLPTEAGLPILEAGKR